MDKMVQGSATPARPTVCAIMATLGLKGVHAHSVQKGLTKTHWSWLFVHHVSFAGICQLKEYKCVPGYLDCPSRQELDIDNHTDPIRSVK
jgi:hypothetical protein